MSKMTERIAQAFRESAALKEQFLKEHLQLVEQVSRALARVFDRGGKLILFGNGGSATDASHLAAEFVNRFRLERPPLPALALNTDMAVLTSISNDYDYADVFAKQLKALGQEGDMVLAITTSGASPNVLRALEVARRRRLTTVLFTGAKGKRLAQKVDFPFVVPSANTPRVQEVHITLGHVICQMVEEILFEAPGNNS